MKTYCTIKTGAATCCQGRTGECRHEYLKAPTSPLLFPLDEILYLDTRSPGKVTFCHYTSINMCVQLGNKKVTLNHAVDSTSGQRRNAMSLSGIFGIDYNIPIWRSVLHMLVLVYTG